MAISHVVVLTGALLALSCAVMLTGFPAKIAAQLVQLRGIRGSRRTSRAHGEPRTGAWSGGADRPAGWSGGADPAGRSGDEAEPPAGRSGGANTPAGWSSSWNTPAGRSSGSNTPAGWSGDEAEPPAGWSSGADAMAGWSRAGAEAPAGGWFGADAEPQVRRTWSRRNRADLRALHRLDRTINRPPFADRAIGDRRLPPIEQIAAELRRLDRQRRRGFSTESEKWSAAVATAYDAWLLAACRRLNITEHLTALAGMDRDIERVRVEEQLQTAGLVLRSTSRGR